MDLLYIAMFKVAIGTTGKNPNMCHREQLEEWNLSLLPTMIRCSQTLWLTRVRRHNGASHSNDQHHTLATVLHLKLRIF